LLGFLGAFAMAPAKAQVGPAAMATGAIRSFGDNDEDPRVLLRDIRQRRTQRDSLFPVSPLKPLHEGMDQFEEALYEATRLRLGLTVNHLFQAISDSLPGTDRTGSTTDLDLVGSWELFDVGKPTQGQLVFGLEGRWDYNTTGPQDLGFVNLGSQLGTGNAFSAYTPTFIMRNLYWEQGSPEAGWAFRTGKITPDAILATSRHITPVTTFLPNAGTGLFSSGYPDSGLGFVGALYFGDDFKVVGLVSDASANRFDFGDLSAWHLYKALEIAARINPKSDQAGFSKFTIWHNDGPADGLPINASTGVEGWGMTVKHEHEFTDDGNAVGVLRWGRSWQDSSLYRHQAGAHFLLYDPALIGTIEHDLVGIGANWADPTAAGSRDETNLEVFYRFPLFPGVDTTLSYQSVFDPALNPTFDHASVFSLRLRTVF
jgi:hypothetical protein